MTDEKIFKQYPAKRESQSLNDTLVHFVKKGATLSQICDVFGAAGLLAKEDGDSKKFYGYRNEILAYLASVPQSASTSAKSGDKKKKK